jgi:iron(III) transport system substrate-binding protein
MLFSFVGPNGEEALKPSRKIHDVEGRAGLDLPDTLDHDLSMNALPKAGLRCKFPNRPRIGILSVGAILLALSCFSLAKEQEVLPYPPSGQVPSGYPPEYAATIRAAEDEGKLIIYSNTDIRVASDLVEDFRKVYPKIEVEYEDLNSTELHYRFISETLLGHDSADIVWSSAMDQQFSLVDKDYAQAYASPEVPNLPEWAVWKNQAFGTTYEPVAVAYNKRMLAAGEVPQTRSDLIRLLNTEPDRFKGKVVTYNIEKSGLGFLLATQDANASQSFWDLVRALGNAGARFQLTTDAMLKRVASGKDLIAYNVLGSYALAEAKKSPSLGYVFPKDYTLVMSRIMFINQNAKNPNAAKLWMDYLLSKRGQTVIANRTRLYSIRNDVEGEATASSLKQALGDSIKPITIGPDLITYLSNPNHRDFLNQWRQTALKK